MRNVHYFQRYHTRENVHTANAMLLLSRLYYYSPDKFYEFIKPLFEQNGEVNLTLQIGIQDKNAKTNTIPDAVISQESFKIVIETKLTNEFSMEQLQGHADDFNDERNKLLLTLDREEISDNIKNMIKDFCKNKGIIHTHMTFEALIDGIREQIDDRDYDFIDILDDYESYCNEDKLLPTNKYKIDMRIAKDTIDKNSELGLYYYGESKGFSNCDYLGLYKKKAMRAIGKISKICVISVPNQDANNPQIVVKEEYGKINEEDMQKIREAIIDAQTYGYHLEKGTHRFFIVDKFYETDFKTIARGKKIFDIREVLGIRDNDLPPVSEIAELLKGKTWK